MNGTSTWGALLVAWLLVAPLIGVVVSAAWGGSTTAMRRHAHLARDIADVPPDRVDYAQTAGDRTIARDSMRDQEIRDREFAARDREQRDRDARYRDPPRH
jgi:hypothetical protein